MSTLPRTRTFIESLLSTLSEPEQDGENTSRNPLKHVTENNRAILMTLHVLFPNELLPALDLLDRGLVTRFTIKEPTRAAPLPASPDTETATSNTPPPLPPPPLLRAATAAEEAPRPPETGRGGAAAGSVYYVRSAQQSNPHSKRYRDPVASSTHYEVRPLAWSCSCPAFVFAAFPSQLAGSEAAALDECAEEGGGDGDEGMFGDEGWIVGGLSLGGAVPVCKHLLACTLVEKAELFRKFVKVEQVSMEGMAGWAAGWGG